MWCEGFTLSQRIGSFLKFENFPTLDLICLAIWKPYSWVLGDFWYELSHYHRHQVTLPKMRPNFDKHLRGVHHSPQVERASLLDRDTLLRNNSS